MNPRASYPAYSLSRGAPSPLGYFSVVNDKDYSIEILTSQVQIALILNFFAGGEKPPAKTDKITLLRSFRLWGDQA